MADIITLKQLCTELKLEGQPFSASSVKSILGG